MRKSLLVLSLLFISVLQAKAQCTLTTTMINNSPVCEGGTLQLGCVVGGGAMPYAYQWSSSNNNISFTSPSFTIPNVSQAYSGTYMVIVIDANACIDTAYTNVSILPLPVVTASGNSPVCEGDTLDLDVNTINGATYIWTGPNSYTATWQNAIIPNALPIYSGTYTVMASLNGCMSLPSSVYALVNPEPVIPTVVANTPLCEGDTLNLSASTSTTGVTFNWWGPNSFTSSQQNPEYLNVPITGNGIYYATVTANGCSSTGSVNVVVNQAPNISTTYTDPTTINSNDGSIVISGLNTGSSYVINYTKNGVPMMPVTQTATNGAIIMSSLGVGTYTDITATINGCTSNPAGPIVLTATMLVSDSVWPGDVNYDLIANNLDVLDLGLSYGQAGTTRTGGNNSWTAQASTDWGVLQTNSMDMKHADCNGDGMVDIDDTLAIYNNYGMMHQKGGHLPQAKVTGFPDLFFDMSNVVLTPGATVTIPIKLGTSSIMVQDIYGIAAQVKIDGITPATDLIVSGVSGWMGNSSNTISFQKAIGTTQTDWAYVRKDHSNVTGEGVIGALTFTVPMGSDNQMVNLYFDNVKMISNNGDEIQDFNVIDGNAEVYPTSVATTGGVINSAVIAPNPSDAHAVLQLTTAQASKIAISVVDIVGKTLWTATQNTVTGVQQIALPASDVAPGIYTILITDDKGSVVQTLRWVKK